MEDDSILDFSNMKIDMSEYDDVYVKATDLNKYFIETVTKDKVKYDKDTVIDYTIYTYYLVYPCGFEIKLGDDTSVDFSQQDIKEFKIITEPVNRYNKYSTQIFCYDKNDKWVEDVNIETQKSLKNILFKFEKGDLIRSRSVNNRERLSFILLYEKLNPYNSNEENYKVVSEWINKYWNK